MVPASSGQQGAVCIVFIATVLAALLIGIAKAAPAPPPGIVLDEVCGGGSWNFAGSAYKWGWGGPKYQGGDTLHPGSCPKSSCAFPKGPPSTPKFVDVCHFSNPPDCKPQDKADAQDLEMVGYAIHAEKQFTQDITIRDSICNCQNQAQIKSTVCSALSAAEQYIRDNHSQHEIDVYYQDIIDKCIHVARKTLKC